MAILLASLLVACSPPRTPSIPDAVSVSANGARAGGAAAVLVPLPSELLIDQLVRRMSVRELAGQMLMVSLEYGEDGPVTRLGDAERELLARLRPGSVILFAANIRSVTQVQDLLRDLQATAAVPLLIATDHEGGLVSRLTAGEEMAATVMPSATLLGIAARALRAAGDRDGARELGREWGAVIGRELRALGITVNMAPVADIDPVEGPGFLGQQRRTFGADPELVADLVVAATAGMRSAGVIGVVKHFPGHGAAQTDTHAEVVALDHTPEELRARELRPFSAAIDGGAQAVMTAHSAYPRVTGDLVPATISRQLLTGLLREELGFEGVVITDALNMEAVAGRLAPGDLALAAVAAGADLLLKPVDPVAVHTVLVEAVDSGVVPRERLEESVRRIMRLKLGAGLFGPAAPGPEPDADRVLGSDAHQAFVAGVRQLAYGGGQ